MKRVISLLLSLLIVCGVSVFPIMGVYAAELTAQDKMALEMANQYKIALEMMQSLMLIQQDSMKKLQKKLLSRKT